jgi:hypothetical protein
VLIDLVRNDRDAVLVGDGEGLQQVLAK